ncbi:MAG TPA: hypothetical protein VGJ86_06815 [Acidimicrobiales bacterium]|jgi:hypothetical protein
MGNLLGSNPVARRRPVLLGLVALWTPLLAVAACGGDDKSDNFAQTEATSTTETTTGLLPCDQDRHMVAFDVIGFLTQENVELVGPWVDTGTTPTPRAGTVELANAYRERGYEILYLTTLEASMDLHGQPVGDAMSQWLVDSGYPMGEGIGQLWVWDGTRTDDGQTWVSITDELLRLAGEGVTMDAGYSENADKIYAMATGGVAAEHLYSLTSPPAVAGAPSSAPSVPIPGDDVVAHLATIQALSPVCQVAAIG